MRLLAANIHMLIANDARHTKSGNRLQSLSDTEIFDHLRAEVDELSDAPDDVDEMGDILCILFHLAHRRGWSPRRMEEAALKKLSMRFEIADKPVASTNLWQ